MQNNICFPCKFSDRPFKTCKVNWDHSRIIKTMKNRMQTDLQGGFSNHAQDINAHRYQKPQQNLLIFGFHLDFLEINQKLNCSRAACRPDCNVCIAILIDSQNTWKPKQVNQRKANIDWAHATSILCTYCTFVQKEQLQLNWNAGR